MLHERVSLMSLVVTLLYDSEFTTSTTTLTLILEKLRVYLFVLIGEVRRFKQPIKHPYTTSPSRILCVAVG